MYRPNRPGPVYGPWIVATLGLLLWHNGPARAEPRQMVFTRVYDGSSLDAMDIAASYAFETGTRFNPDGSEQATSLKHRLRVCYGVADGLSLSVEQTIKHHLDQEAKLGVFRPELRLSLTAMFPGGLGRLPVDINTFVAPRVRVTGRRDSSIVLGLGTRNKTSGWVLTANAGVEVTVPDAESETNVGPRYDAGVGVELFDRVMLELEAWGHAAWAQGSFVEQEHAAGPSIVYFAGPFRFGVNGSVWLRNAPGVDLRTDIRGTFVVGLTL